MNPSKENGIRALAALRAWKESSPERTLVSEFLAAAMRWLPSEATLARKKVLTKDRKHRKVRSRKPAWNKVTKGAAVEVAAKGDSDGDRT